MAEPGVLEHSLKLPASLADWDTTGVWPNFGPPHDEATALRAYRRETLQRLARVVAAYDPGEVIAAARYLRTRDGSELRERQAL